MNALVVEGVGVLAELLAPLLSHVEIPVVLAHHHADGGLERLQDLAALLEFLRLTELREVAAVEDEVGLGGERVHVVHRLEDGTHEALVHRLLVEVRVGDVGEAETLPRGLDIHRLEGVG